MNMRHAIWARRFFASLVFAMFLVLTPRAWVDTGSEHLADEIPVNALEKPTDCLWCEPEPAGCDDSKDGRESNEPWLNPDVPLSAPSSPCLDTEARPSPRA